MVRLATWDDSTATWDDPGIEWGPSEETRAALHRQNETLRAEAERQRELLLAGSVPARNAVFAAWQPLADWLAEGGRNGTAGTL